MRHKLYAATNTQRQNLYFNYMTYKRPYLIWNALTSHALTICVKWRQLIKINEIMVLNNDVKMINQVLPFCIYGPGYRERCPMIAIIKIKLMFHLQSITCSEYFLKLFSKLIITRMLETTNVIRNVTSIMALTVWWRQSVDLVWFVDYCMLSIRI